MVALAVAGQGPFLSASWYRVAGLRPALSGHARIRIHRYRGRLWHVVSDPISGRVHRLSPAALAIVAAMDGQRTVDAIWQAAAARLGDDAPSQDQVLHLLGQLHAGELLKADAVPDTRELLARFAAHERQRWRGLLNPLSLRIPLWNPERLIDRLLPVFGPAFSAIGALIWLALVIPALVLAWRDWSALTTDIGDRILAADNLVLMAVCLPVVKLLHELGHGLAARRFGARVPEIGAMFLVLVPMPYVDVSSAAALRSRLRRITVGGAGMLAELGLAALAMFVWEAVEPGLVRAIAFNVMVTASIATVMFNANPLMRFDGYYMLSDWLEIPNLAQRAGRWWTDFAERRLFGRADGGEARPTQGERAWFIAYAPLSLAYRLSVTFGIALFLAEHYWAAGVALGAWCLFTAVLLPLGKAIRHVLAGAGLQRHRVRAVGVTLAGIGLAAAGLLLVPAPHHTLAEGVIWLPPTAQVRATADGFVERVLAEPGVVLPSGSAIVQAADPALRARLEGLRARVAELRAQLQADQFDKLVDARVDAAELAHAETELAQVTRRHAQLVARIVDGGRLAIPRAADLPGRFVKDGELIGYVLPEAGGRVVRAVVPQDELELVRTSLRRARLQIAGHPGEEFATRIVREVPAGRDALPDKALGTAGGGTIAVDPRDPKGLRTLRRTFQIDLELPADAPGDAFGARAFVRLEHAWEPLGTQLYRRLRQLLLSRLQA